MSKKLEEKQRRRLAEERKRAEQKKASRRRNLTTIAIAAVVTIAVVALVYNDRRAAQQQIENVGVSEAAANCDGIEEHEIQGQDHIPEGSPHEPYNSQPPTSGPHYAAPAGPVNPGFYDTPLVPEALVHNLEHGQIVIWYRPDAPEDVISDIELLVDQEPVATAATPYSDIESPANLVLTAWGASMACEQVSQVAVDEFRSSFQGQGPEPLTPPFRG